MTRKPQNIVVAQQGVTLPVGIGLGKDNSRKSRSFTPRRWILPAAAIAASAPGSAARSGLEPAPTAASAAQGRATYRQIPFPSSLRPAATATCARYEPCTPMPRRWPRQKADRHSRTPPGSLPPLPRATQPRSRPAKHSQASPQQAPPPVLPHESGTAT